MVLIHLRSGIFLTWQFAHDLRASNLWDPSKGLELIIPYIMSLMLLQCQTFWAVQFHEHGPVFMIFDLTMVETTEG